MISWYEALITAGALGIIALIVIEYGKTDPRLISMIAVGLLAFIGGRMSKQ